MIVKTGCGTDGSICGTNVVFAQAGDADEAAMVESGKQELGLREAKFLYYWATFTETYTHFTTTSTWSLLSVACTPPNWTLNPCKAAANG